MQRVLQVEHRLLPAAVGLFCEGRLRIEGERLIYRKRCDAGMIKRHL